MRILAIETSCDETAAAVVEDGTKILSNVVASSADMHQKFGGIVPEIAAREQLRCIIPVIQEALVPLQQFNNQDLGTLSSSGLTRGSRSKHRLDSRLRGNDNEGLCNEVYTTIQQCIKKNIDALAVTIGPGLVGSLLIGVETAKTIAFVTGKPIIPVNHVLAHMYANFVIDESSVVSRQSSDEYKNLKAESRKLITFPAISLVVSGGHTELYLMKSMKNLQWLGGTLDDAAGEAFDKTGRLLGFGNGGGVAIQKSASMHQDVDVSKIKLPRPMLDDKTLNFSFSGLKTAILREVNKLKDAQQFSNTTIQQLAYETQEAITDVLVAKTLRATEIHEAKSILLSGGVAANLRLREKFSLAMQQYSNTAIFIPPVSLCTDNAAYIASYAFFRGKPIDWRVVTAIPDLVIDN